MIDRGDAVFSRDSPVLAYWLSRCDGFDVRMGRRGLGEVQGVATHDRLGRAEVLRVRSPLRQKLLPADRIAAVVPGRRLLIVEQQPTLFRRFGRAALQQRHGIARLAGEVAVSAKPHLNTFGRFARAAAVQIGRLAVIGIQLVVIGMQLAAVGMQRGGAWLERQVRWAMPIVLAAVERAATRAGRLTVAASRAGADAARTLGSEMRERSRR